MPSGWDTKEGATREAGRPRTAHPPSPPSDPHAAESPGHNSLAAAPRGKRPPLVTPVIIGTWGPPRLVPVTGRSPDRSIVYMEVVACAPARTGEESERRHTAAGS